jgi:uncharacterized membrane protein YheB (UPF0754 family)
MNSAWIGFFISVLVGGFIGWFTNVLAVKALFRPRQPWRIGPFSFQGILPKRHLELAERLGETVEENLLNSKELAGQVKPADLEPLVNEMVAEYSLEMKKKVEKDFPKMAFLLQPLIDFGGPVVAGAIRQRLPAMVARGADLAAQKISIKTLVREKVEKMDLGKLEKVILSVSGRELVLIERLGGILGMMVGAVQWWVLSWL